MFKDKQGAGDATHWGECLPSFVKPWAQSQFQVILGLECTSGIPALGRWRSGIQVHLWLPSEFDTSLGYKRPCLNQTNNKKRVRLCVVP